MSTLALSRRYSPVHRIDGAWFARLVTAGARWVCAHREELNRINVFPVVDGDTGTNMAATLRAVARSLEKADKARVTALSARAKAAAEGCLMGARGNSGMILCHVFSSLSAGIGEQESLEPRELARILRTASADLYRALDQPVEGTILTVLRESTAHGGLDGCADLESLIALLVREARIALEKTPEQLEALRKAQVVDSGALGYVYFLEGMLREVQGQSLPVMGDEVAPSPTARKAKIHEESPHFRFCTEVVIESRSPLTTGRLRTLFRPHGDSLIPLLTGRLAKVHIHTNSPEDVFAVAATVGDVVRTKVEDMRTQSAGMFAHDGTALPGARIRTRIVCDSTCDMPPEVLSKWGIHMVPLKVLFGEEALRDRVEILPDEFIHRMVISPVHPRTSQPAPDDFAQAFAQHETEMQEGDEILCMTLSSKLSGTFASAKTARDVKGGRVHLYDVPFASAPFGLLVTRAAELAREGKTAAEIIADLDRMKGRTNILFCLDTLEYMKRGGRISWGQAFLGNLLDLKPILEFQDGKMVPHAKVRSKDKARQRVLDDLLKAVPKDRPVRFMLVHSGRPDLLIPHEEFLRQNFQVTQMMNCSAGAVISAHCGPGAWGVAWMVEE